MAHTEDPPYLTVGTEVSAKYRGAFCEATIKTAKKLVKCKVSYGKGQSAVVTSDQIKGQLKVGAQVEVKQPDGQVQLGNITKLTDQSTYTVVFDDGDERTLKRSSLCLKGGRHFHESESLDHLPLTDPENFGTPVMSSTKRKRRRGSQSPSSSTTTPSKKSCSYPIEFPVGKAVFLENDRRRSSWLPAVIVPAHYVLEASDMTPDTICLRSFKDGRYFAATKNELHEFSPSKEPLSSMLEGEIQPMYMCKPAIERAMAYIDTGELPWDMDLFDQNNSTYPNGPLHCEPPTSDDDNSPDEALVAEAKSFDAQLQQFHAARGTPMRGQPTVGPHGLNLFQLYRLVKTNGGMERVTMEMKWRSLYLQLGLPSIPSPSPALRQAYRKYLYQFELHEKNKGKSGGKEGMARRHKPMPPGSDEEQQDAPSGQTPASHQDRPKQQDKVKRQDKGRLQDKGRQTSGEGKQRVEAGAVKAGAVKEGAVKEGAVKEEGESTKVNGVEKDKPRKVLLAEHKSIKMVRVNKLPKSLSVEVKQEQPPPVPHEESEPEDHGSDVKSEGSDMESAPIPGGGGWTREDMVTNLDCSSTEQEGLMRNLEQCSAGYKENDRVLVFYGKGKGIRTYQAKVIQMERSEHKCDYLVHYSGWNNRYDEWIDSSRIAGKLNEFTKRPHFSSKTKKMPPAPRSASTSILKPSTIPPGLLSPSLQAIISHTSPQDKNTVVKREKDQESVSGKTVSNKCSPPGPVLSASKGKTSPTTPNSSPSSEPSTNTATLAGAGVTSTTTPGSTSAAGNSRHLRGSARGGATRGRGGRVGERSRTKQALTTPTSTPSDTNTTAKTDNENNNVNSSPPSSSTSSPSLHTPPLTSPHLPPQASSSDDITSSSSSAGSEDDQPTEHKPDKHPVWSPPQATPLSPSTSVSNSNHSPATAATLVCSESLPGLVLKTLATSTSLSPAYTSALSLLAEPAAQSLLSLSASAPALPPVPLNPFIHTTADPSSGPTHTSPLKQDQENSREKAEVKEDKGEEMEASPLCSDLNSVELDSTHTKSSDSVSGFGSGSGSASEREGSPLLHERSPSKGSSHSPEGKRKWRPHDEESREEYEKRKKARHSEMNYTLDFSQLSPMTSVERISLIQEQLKKVQGRWSDLKAEVAYIERKRRRVKRREREAAQVYTSTTVPQEPSNATPSPSQDPTSPSQPQLNNTPATPCH